jgi:hypothetical protein
MRRYHLVIVTALVGAIAACLMVRTPDASASSESVTYIAQTEAPKADAAPVVEDAAPPNDPVLNEALAKEEEAAAAPAQPAKPIKEAKAFAQTPKSSRKTAGVKAKKSSKVKKAKKTKKTAKHPKKKKKKAKKA